jgi:hypothetical protein
MQDEGNMDRNESYYEQLQEYEKTRLREFFFEEMVRVCSEWVQVYEASKRQRDFEEVVTFFGMAMMGMKIEEWVCKVESG